MRERCLNLADWEARALLAGATQIRRPVVPQPSTVVARYKAAGDPYLWIPVGTDGIVRANASWLQAPLSVGDVLLGRETWLLRGAGKSVIYRADYSGVDAAGIAGMYSDRGWRSSSQMPRWAVRIRRVVTAVRVEKVQDITEIDRNASGVPRILDSALAQKVWYEQWWDSRHAARYPWASNPWTFVFELQNEVTP